MSEMVRLNINTAHIENSSLLVKDSLGLNDWFQASYHYFPRGNISFNQEIDKKVEENVRKQVKDNITNQATLSNDVGDLYDNHLIEKRENKYLENAFIASQDSNKVSKYEKYSETDKLKKPETTETKRFRGNYEGEKLERIKYSETENEPHYAGDRSEYESIEKNRKISKAHTRSNNALRKRPHNKDSSRNIRSRQSIRGVHKSQNNVKPSKASLNKFENSVRAIDDPSRSQQHYPESSNNLISKTGAYFRNHKKRSSAEHSEDANAIGYSSPDSASPELLLNTHINKENYKNKENGILKFNDYGFERFDGQEGENFDYGGNNEKPLSAEDDINLYLDNFNIYPNTSSRLINGYRSKSEPSLFSKNQDHINNVIHVHPTNPVLNANDNFFQNLNFTLPADLLITESNKIINQEENKVENLPQDPMQQFANNTFSEVSNGDNNTTCANNQTTNKDVFDEHTTEMVHIIDKDENITFLDVTTFSEITVSDFTEFSLFTESTESTTEIQESQPPLTSTKNEIIETNEEDDTDDILANEVIFKVLKKVEENEELREHILPSLQINSVDIKNRKKSHKASCTLNSKSVINKMSHELESLVENEVHETECLVLSPQQKSSLTRLLEFAKKEENIIENNDEGGLKKLVKSHSKDTDTSFAEAMTKKMATLKHLLSQYERLSEDEKLKVHNVHEYLIEQLNNVYRLINLDESHGYETYFSHDNDQTLKSDSNSPMGKVDLQKTNSAYSAEKSKQDKYNGINSISEESPTSDHSQHESSIANSLSNILDTLKKHISRNEFNKEHKNDPDKKKNKHSLKVRNMKEISKRSGKSRAKRKSERPNQDLKSGGISSTYYKLALLAKQN